MQADRRAGALLLLGFSRARDPADSARVVPGAAFLPGIRRAPQNRPNDRRFPCPTFCTHSLSIPLSLFIFFFFSFPLIHFTAVRLPADIIIVIIIMAVGVQKDLLKRSHNAPRAVD